MSLSSSFGLLLFLLGLPLVNVASQNYADALTKSILFFEGQRSGKLPPSQRLKWRKDSALHDGDGGVDLIGGYYDAGDNVKFNFPMAFTATVLAWSVSEFGDLIGSELGHANDAVRWGADYLLKCTSIQNRVYVQIGDPESDHTCCQRPEDMDTDQTTFFVTDQNPGSEVAAETSAALASSSIVFKSSDPGYSKQLLQRAIQVFEFADKYRGKYSDHLCRYVCPYYCDMSGYEDLLAKGKEDQNIFIKSANTFFCGMLPESSYKYVQYSQGGSNMQHTTALSFLLLVYARYLSYANNVVPCDGELTKPARLVEVVKGQVYYILGKNPMKMSYIVGYRHNFPQNIHHRGSILPSIDSYPKHLVCHDGTPYFKSSEPNLNALIGAVVGGPWLNDTYIDI